MGWQNTENDGHRHVLLRCDVFSVDTCSRARDKVHRRPRLTRAEWFSTTVTPPPVTSRPTTQGRHLGCILFQWSRGRQNVHHILYHIRTNKNTKTFQIILFVIGIWKLFQKYFRDLHVKNILSWNQTNNCYYWLLLLKYYTKLNLYKYWEMDCRKYYGIQIKTELTFLIISRCRSSYSKYILRIIILYAHRRALSCSSLPTSEYNIIIYILYLAADAAWKPYNEHLYMYARAKPAARESRPLPRISFTRESGKKCVLIRWIIV